MGLQFNYYLCSSQFRGKQDIKTAVSKICNVSYLIILHFAASKQNQTFSSKIKLKNKWNNQKLTVTL